MQTVKALDYLRRSNYHSRRLPSEHLHAPYPHRSPLQRLADPL
jgi:hypothetical protein